MPASSPGRASAGKSCRSLIQLHIATGEPVGSESLARALHRSLSSATLRNIMADLEKLGYLDHPHTSAGRVPTDEGYGVYVDSLMQPRPTSPPRDAAAIALRAARPRRLAGPGDGERLPAPLPPHPQRGLRARPRHGRARASATSTSCACPTRGSWW